MPVTYVVLPDGRVRFRNGIVGTVEREDEEAIWVRVAEVPRFRPVDAEPTAESAAGTHATDTLPRVDRIRFDPFEAGLPRSGQWRHGFDVADLDGDGHADLAFSPPRKAVRPRPIVFLGDGSGSWRLWTDARFPALAYDYGTIAAGDLDGDGARDLVLGMHLQGIVALRAVGGGVFEPFGTLSSAAGVGGFSSVALALADIDGDSDLDVLALGEGPRPPELSGARGLRLFANLGDGAWEGTSPHQQELAENFGRDLAVADLDADGRMDALSATGRVGFRKLLGLRTLDGGFRSVSLEPFPPGRIVDAVAAGDLDVDGDIDLVVRYRERTSEGWRGGVDVLMLDGPRLTRTAIHREADPDGFGALAIGDVDGDGAPDLAAGVGRGGVRIWLGGPSGLMAERAPELAQAGGGCACAALRLSDLDGDTRAELVAAFAGDSCSGGGSVRAFRAISP